MGRTIDLGGKKLRVRVLLGAVAGLLTCGLVSHAEATPKLGPVDHRLHGEEAPVTMADVQLFLRQQENDVADVNESGSNVCSFAFTTLGGRKSPILLASVDASGRGFCNTVVAVGTSAGKVWVTAADGWEIDKISTAVRDIGGPRRPYLLIPQPLSFYAGVNCIAVTKHVYDIVGEKLVDVSSTLPSYFKAELKDWHPYYPVREDGATCAAMEHDKLLRMARVDPTAGEARAVQWSKSPSTDLRQKAIDIFKDIGDPKSIEHLERDFLKLTRMGGFRRGQRSDSRCWLGGGGQH